MRPLRNPSLKYFQKQSFHQTKEHESFFTAVFLPSAGQRLVFSPKFYSVSPKVGIVTNSFEGHVVTLRIHGLLVISSRVT